mgnify:CR=1 FL=1
MKTTLVRYRTLPDRASENEVLIHGVFDELRRAVGDAIASGSAAKSS